MASLTGCLYAQEGSVAEKLQEFAWHTGQQAAVAMVVNALCMYLLGEEDVTPGLINGAMTAVSINTVHKLTHTLWVKKRGESQYAKTGRQACYLALLGVVNYYSVSHLSKYFGFKLSNQNILEQTVFSYIGVLSLNYYLNIQAQRNRGA
jgi:hypothetical protein